MRIGFNIFGACPRQTSNKNNNKKIPANFAAGAPVVKQHKIRLIGHNNNNIILHCSRAICVDYVIIIVICRALLKLHAVAPMISLCFYLCSFFLFHSIEAGSTFRISQTFVPLHCVANDHLLLSAVASACSLHLAVL